MKLPHNTDMEQGVICAAIMRNELIPNLRAIVTPEDMYGEFNRTAWNVVLSCYDKYGSVDETFIDEFQKNETDLGETSKISGLLDAPASADPVRGALVLRRHAAKRRLILSASKASKAGDADTIQKIMQAAIEKYNKDILSESDNIPASKTAEELIDWFEAAVEDPDSVKGLPSGFVDIDRMTNGMHNSDLIIIAARPGVGKSAFAGQIADAVAIGGDAVGFISLEMPDNQLVMRSASRISGVGLKKIRSATASKTEQGKIFTAFAKYGNLPITINDKGGLTRDEIFHVAVEMKKSYAIKLLIIDYLQLVKFEKESRYDGVTNTSALMKTLAKRLDIPVILLSQLNRKVEDRRSNRPCMADLRESGAIEQDADIIGFLYEDDDEKGVINYDCQKQRNGPVFAVKFFFRGECLKFMPLDRWRSSQVFK